MFRCVTEEGTTENAEKLPVSVLTSISRVSECDGGRYGRECRETCGQCIDIHITCFRVWGRTVRQRVQRNLWSVYWHSYHVFQSVTEDGTAESAEKPVVSVRGMRPAIMWTATAPPAVGIFCCPYVKWKVRARLTRQLAFNETVCGTISNS